MNGIRPFWKEKVKQTVLKRESKTDGFEKWKKKQTVLKRERKNRQFWKEKGKQTVLKSERKNRQFWKEKGKQTVLKSERKKQTVLKRERKTDGFEKWKKKQFWKEKGKQTVLKRERKTDGFEKWKKKTQTVLEKWKKDITACTKFEALPLPQACDRSNCTAALGVRRDCNKAQWPLHSSCECSTWIGSGHTIFKSRRCTYTRSLRKLLPFYDCSSLTLLDDVKIRLGL
jgi:hypothetical protein